MSTTKLILVGLLVLTLCGTLMPAYAGWTPGQHSVPIPAELDWQSQASRLRPGGGNGNAYDPGRSIVPGRSAMGFGGFLLPCLPMALETVLGIRLGW